MNTKNKKDYKILLFLLFIPIFLFAEIFIYNPVVKNGEAVLVFSNQKPEFIKVFNKKYQFFPTIKNKKYKFYTLIPVSYYQKSGVYEIKAVFKNEIDTKKLVVKKGNYKKEFLKVAKKHVSPPKSLIKRIKSEYKEAMKIYNTFDKHIYWHDKFVLPIKSSVTSSFGNARMFNGVLRSYHTGIDYKAKKGTPIKAVNDGVVVLAKKRYFAGNSVVVSHGRGVYSCYYHLSKIVVKKGQKVKKGEIVGLSGQTGRVTGPHLHFSMWLDGVIVNPSYLITLLNKI